MGFTPKLLADGVTATGAATVFTVPGSTTYHIMHMSVSGSVAAAIFDIIINNGTDRLVAQYTVLTGPDPSDAAAPSSPGMAGSVGNLILEAGDILKINRSGGTGECTFTVSGYSIT